MVEVVEAAAFSNCPDSENGPVRSGLIGEVGHDESRFDAILEKLGAPDHTLMCAGRPGFDPLEKVIGEGGSLLITQPVKVTSCWRKSVGLGGSLTDRAASR
jgi:hypothetical protein